MHKNHGNSNNYKFQRTKKKWNKKKNDEKIKCGKNLFENHNEEDKTVRKFYFHFTEMQTFAFSMV